MKEYRTIREVNGPLMVVDQVEVEVALGSHFSSIK